MSIKSFLGSLFAREQGRSKPSGSSAQGCRSIQDLDKAERQGRAGQQHALDKLVETLKSEDQEMKWAAQSALARVGMRAFDSLVTALHSSEFDLYFGAERAIVQMGDPQLFPRLVPLLSNTNDNVRGLVAGILGELKDPRAVGVLTTCLGDPYHMVRVAAVKSLKALGWEPETAQERVVCAVAVAHGDVVTGKYQDAIAFGKPAIGPLSVALLSGGWVVAEQAARALAQIADESALPALEDALGWNVRERGLSFGNAQNQALVALVTILARLGRLTPRSDEEVSAILSAPGSLDRSAPLEHVKTADNLNVGDVIRVWHDYLDHWATGWLEVMHVVRKVDLVCLRQLPGKELIVRGLSDTVGSAWRWPRNISSVQLSVHSETADAMTSDTFDDISQLSSEDVEKLKAIVLKDANPARRMAALERFLSGSEPVEVMVLSELACRSADASIRARAISRLRERGSEPRARFLIMHLRDQLNAEERMWAAESLAEIGL